MRSATAVDWPEVQEDWKREALTLPYEWPEEHRTLYGEDDCAEPGPWNNDRTPYGVGLMMMGEIGGWVRRLAVKKAARLGISEVCRNIVGYRQDTKPGPSMITNATRGKTEEVLEKQLLPLFERNARLARHFKKKAGHTIHLQRTALYCGWPNSPVTMSDRSIRDCYTDECNKFPQWSKGEAGPIELIEVRMDTYEDQRFHFILSSPTHSTGTISIELQSCPVVLVYQVPCPDCGEYQVYEWGQVRWPKVKGMQNKHLSAKVGDEGLGYYECKHCGVGWKDEQKHAICLKGVYTFTEEKDGKRIPETVTEADIRKEHKELEDRLGRKVKRVYNHVIWKGRRPHHVGVHLCGLVSPWRSYSRFAAEYLRCCDDPIKMQNFRNSWLGEDYEYEAAEVKADAFEAKFKIGGPRYKAPRWSSCILATADTQKEYFYYNLRAWGPGYRSQLVDQGLVQTFEELKRRCLETEYEVDEPGWGCLTPLKLLIDAGGGAIPGEDTTRTWEVYQFALADKARRIMPLHGHGGAHIMHEPYQVKTIDYTPPDQRALPKDAQRPEKVTYLRINVDMFKDLLSARIANPVGHPAYWGLHNERDRDFIAQMSSEHKILEGQGDKQRFAWRTKTTGAANHQWDNEVYQMAGSQYMRIDKIPAVGDLVERDRLDKVHLEQSKRNRQEEWRRW